MIGHGIEIVATAQIEELIEQIGACFELEHFTSAERNHSKLSPDPIQYFASRLAAKKVVIRVLGIEAHPHSWHEIEIQRLPSGEPTIVLYGRCQAMAAERGITKWLLSISHTSSYAAASAIALQVVAKPIVPLFSESTAYYPSPKKLSPELLRRLYP